LSAVFKPQLTICLAQVVTLINTVLLRLLFTNSLFVYLTESLLLVNIKIEIAIAQILTKTRQTLLNNAHAWI